MHQAISRFIDQLLPREHPRPEIELLYRMMRDYPERGGKMLRGTLVLLSARAHGGRDEHALPLAAALELFQNWVLIHDDIEDDSEERRGRPALHREHGVPLAINAGDALHIYMWQTVLQAGVPGAAEEFLRTIHRTAEGQHVDLGWVEHGRWDLNEADYLEMVQLKTAHYTVVSPLRLGALAAGLEPDPRFLEAGLALGAAFQIRDDILNLTAEGSAYGKEVAGDLLEGKRTLMLLRWLESARADQRDFFLEVMSRPRSEKRLEEIERILRWLLASDAVRYADERARFEAARGLELLEAALESAPDREAVGQIMGTLRQLATRDH
ncbi:geranylgeranyl diphosphate synthase type II [Deinobacterium chartae]|uniref:Geranylgeranyl diphosphate synthase type II n=1 Tax=Deinobacterium chartae TaxID=521158 RepID=A0A841HUZ4_9DEIO|nr:geranylgeranyl diphosphate synthase type II [Deinobacterium chartae]